ncbi:hypothetical protein E2P81_ATG03101 [Venturia nashicola]|uniref:Uncharacterized protein n=1 Tax=Venturia nashicola TaxID=86259 RepID=A0A4Z1P3Y8_9PEZI|nr:hypothetical protein E6O75_ATG03169 [Venturia nashicola]TLD36212.1 hypothetical protein E2P81_ATG03101 [Venturia nashicola]
MSYQNQPSNQNPSNPSTGASQQYYQPPSNPPPGQQQYQQPSYQQQGYQHSSPLGSNPTRHSDTDLLPQGQERSEQMEHFQNYEAQAKVDEDSQNQAILEKEFPTIDGSLIAAIYGDSKSLSATREMLQELSSET